MTLEEEKKKSFFFVVVVSEYKNIDKLSFGEHGLFVLNCFSRYVALQSKQSLGSRIIDWLSTDVTSLKVKESYHLK